MRCHKLERRLSRIVPRPVRLRARSARDVFHDSVHRDDVRTQRHERRISVELGEHVRRSVRRKIEDLSGTRPVVEVSLVRAD